MGFRPYTNKGLILPKGRAGDIVRKRWGDREWNLDEIGDRLDASLDSFFRYCAAEDIPVIAHAAMSNGSMAGADTMAATLHWLERPKTVDTYRRSALRSCLGHFTMVAFTALLLDEALKMNPDPELRKTTYLVQI